MPHDYLAGRPPHPERVLELDRVLDVAAGQLVAQRLCRAVRPYQHVQSTSSVGCPWQRTSVFPITSGTTDLLGARSVVGGAKAQNRGHVFQNRVKEP